MPAAGLVMATRKVTLRRQRKARGTGKAAVAVLLALVAVVAPVDAPRVPVPIDSVIGTGAAAAQTSPGTPDQCGDPLAANALDWPYPIRDWPYSHDADDLNLAVAGEWTPQPTDPDFATSPVCVLQIPPCPPVPWIATPPEPEFLEPAAEYPDFCEIVIDVTDPTLGHLYSDCADAALLGSTVALITDDPGVTCTVRTPMSCPVGLRRAHDACRVIQRRSWTCTSGLERGNGFNTCFEVRGALSPGVHHPACGVGAPDFGAVSCEQYVGVNYLLDPTLQPCDTTPSYDTGPHAPSLDNITPSVVASDHWCSYDARQLDVRCHTDPTDPTITHYHDGDCAMPLMAFCLKRSGDTGGCSGVARTIRCAVLMAPHIDGYQNDIDPANLRQVGCTPCIVLPFTHSLTRCPDDVAASPHLGTVRTSNACGPSEAEILEARESLDHVAADASSSCGGTVDTSHAVCPDPSRASLIWGTNHLAGRAVVDTAVTFRIDHVPVQAAQRRYLWSTSAGSGYMNTNYWPGGRSRIPAEFQAATYASDMQIVQLIGRPVPGASASSLHDLVGVLCYLEEAPAFVVEIEELWPDVDRDAIEEHFDVNLQWWADLPQEEQQRLTTLRGFEWIGPMVPLTDPGRLAEIERRKDEHSVLTSCNSTPREYVLPFAAYAHTPLPSSAQQTQTWCRWTPERSGWFRATALGAWHMDVRPRPQWRPRTSLSDAVGDWINWLNDATDLTRNGLTFDAFILPETTSDSTEANNSLFWWTWCWHQQPSPGRPPDNDSIGEICGATRADRNLAEIGFVPGPADFGLEADPTGTFVRPVQAMPTPSSTDPDRDNELYRFGDTALGAYRSELSSRARYCPSMDIRIDCGEGGQTLIGKFTESEPAYITVHELRTRSVPTSP